MTKPFSFAFLFAFLLLVGAAWFSGFQIAEAKTYPLPAGQTCPSAGSPTSLGSLCYELSQAAGDGYCPASTSCPSGGLESCSCSGSGSSQTCSVNCLNSQDTYQWATDFLINFLDPFYTIIVVTARLVGILLVIWGLLRLKRGAQHNMMYRISPIATTFFFVVGAIFTSFMPDVLSFSQGFFSGYSVTPADGGATYGGMNQYLTYPCSATGTSGSNTGVPLSLHAACPVLGYYTDITTHSSYYQYDTASTLLQVIYAILLVVGLLSFLRGCLFLLRLGEGNAQEGSMQKAVVHIVAGVIGMNAELFHNMLVGVIPSAGQLT